jgi:flavin-dependent dehydrogenase
MSEAVADTLYDVVIIGAGPVGEVVAERARAGGLSVAAVERELVGGECSYWACSRKGADPGGPADAGAGRPLRDQICMLPRCWGPRGP